jgi:hypothetical protein
MITTKVILMLLGIADQHSKMSLMMSTISSNLMTKTEISDAIAAAFANLSELSAQVYDYWITQLYDENDNMIAEEWNEQTLNMMEDDVMNLSMVTENV